MDLRVSVGPLAPTSFTCHDELWSISAAASTGSESGSEAVLAVEGDTCWEQNVIAHVDQLSVRYDPSSDSILLSGAHRMTAAFSLPLAAVLTRAEGCEV